MPAQLGGKKGCSSRKPEGSRRSKTMFDAYGDMKCSSKGLADDSSSTPAKSTIATAINELFKVV